MEVQCRVCPRSFGVDGGVGSRTQAAVLRAHLFHRRSEFLNLLAGLHAGAGRQQRVLQRGPVANSTGSAMPFLAGQTAANEGQMSDDYAHLSAAAMTSLQQLTHAGARHRRARR